MTQSWGRVSEAVAERCQPSRIRNLCHVKEHATKYPPLHVSSEIRAGIISELIESKINIIFK